MKIAVKREVKKEYEVKYLMIDIPVFLSRDERSDAPLDFPLIFGGDRWIAWIDIDTGIIEDWEQGYEGRLFSKVVDEGHYYLFDADRKLITARIGYVPNELLPPVNGYSDYIELLISKKGKITNWYETPSLKEFEYYMDDDE
jgi:hypothetical protein